MKIAMMSYTLARGDWGKKPDIAVLCRLANELGLEGVDWVTTYGHSPSEVRKITADHGLVSACYTFGARIQDPDPEAQARGMDAVREGLDAAAELGVDKVMVVVSGIPGVPRDTAREVAIKNLKQIVPMGAALGLAVTVEHFPGADSPFAVSADVNAAIAEVPGLKVTLDSGNVLMGGENPADGYLNSWENIIHAHFKDWELAEDGRPGLDGRLYRPALIGEGLVDPEPVVRAMASKGYAGFIDFEYEGNVYSPEEAMRKGVPPLKDLIARVMEEAA
ncbi:MAG: sugar phosphate isomerase/epimerase [Armatimonadetes bacterium]|nr:sugar phosphate isomerase/epimerase [Armatimonadota bacterium]MDI9585848.1 sugar phosphate isomerase/epimerase family protein [Acidobacteriota bacterium]